MDIANDNGGSSNGTNFATHGLSSFRNLSGTGATEGVAIKSTLDFLT